MPKCKAMAKLVVSYSMSSEQLHPETPYASRFNWNIGFLFGVSYQLWV